MRTAENQIGTVRVLLSCLACGTNIGPCFVEAFLDADGDVAVEADDIAWFTSAHYQPQVVSM